MDQCRVRLGAGQGGEHLEVEDSLDSGGNEKNERAVNVYLQVKLLVRS